MCTVSEPGFDLKLTAKPKALGKPFGKTIIEPFLKTINAKLPEAERLQLGDFEKILVGPGWRRSDAVRDLSASVASVIPDDLHAAGEREAKREPSRAT